MAPQRRSRAGSSLLSSELQPRFSHVYSPARTASGSPSGPISASRAGRGPGEVGLARCHWSPARKPRRRGAPRPPGTVSRRPSARSAAHPREAARQGHAAEIQGIAERGIAEVPAVVLGVRLHASGRPPPAGFAGHEWSGPGARPRRPGGRTAVAAARPTGGSGRSSRERNWRPPIMRGATTGSSCVEVLVEEPGVQRTPPPRWEGPLLLRHRLRRLRDLDALDLGAEPAEHPGPRALPARPRGRRRRRRASRRRRAGGLDAVLEPGEHVVRLDATVVSSRASWPWSAW